VRVHSLTSIKYQGSQKAYGRVRVEKQGDGRLCLHLSQNPENKE